MTECLITRLENTAMIQALHDHPALSQFFTSYLLNRVIRLEADVVENLFNSSEKRLARVLLLLANYGKHGESEPIWTPISQELLAEMTGTSRSRVNAFMNKFRRLGFIDYNGHLKIHGSLLSVISDD